MRSFANIVVLGGSYAGLTIAHKLLRTTIKEIRACGATLRYRVILVSPSTHLYWNIAAPRMICDSKFALKRNSFIPFVDEFQQYTDDEFLFLQGEAVDVSRLQRIVTVKHCSDGKRSGTLYDIQYHALIIASGSSQHSDLLSLHGSHRNTIDAFELFQVRLKEAKRIIIAGGGPSGVECAGQIATQLNGSRIRLKRPNSMYTHSDDAHSDLLKAQETHIMLISGHSHVLPGLNADIRANAETKLKRLGIEIINKLRVISVQQSPEGGYKCLLNDRSSLECDLFLPATGESPNTSFLPPELLNNQSFVEVDPRYLRVTRAGERVYAIGSCCSLENKSLTEIFRCIPVLLHNLQNDLKEHEIRLQVSDVRRSKRLSALKDDVYHPKSSTTQILPLTPNSGIGVYRGRSLPDWAVWLFKGRNYQFSKAKEIARGIGSF
jgi:NADH dehydrogenase FAD-containing subunit